jgi:mono/diheme cytochrome c family protein
MAGKMVGEPLHAFPRARGALGACLLGVLLAAGAARGQPATPPCPDGGTPLRWEDFGRDFFGTHCSACHDYSRYPRVYPLRDLISSLVLSDNMPPFGKVPEEAKRALGEWIACDLPLDGPACPPEGTPLSHREFGRDFFAAHCLGCHASDRTGAARNGAPPGLDWDRLEAVRAHAATITERVLKGSMPPDGPVVPDAEAEQLAEWLACGAPESPPERPFRRGDANGDGALNITDAVRILVHLFRGGTGDACLDALNADGSSTLELTDAVYLLRYLFQPGPPPPPPFTACGNAGPVLGCAAFAACAG